ncbi:uncharacterized protein TM35_000771110 [Trypanosoma theileri]|uniref:Surface protein TolT n=1 Tax=Trypanosoma theileri TaxID=67003 RepID=A0A1X0NFC5_9TRYP|nr:uncharacterized protein TM35_000771110 [Trypanosoma theileri]ORC83149.1 hypothetical protein TM35_000771110 [Trypanosoma theileri]
MSMLSCRVLCLLAIVLCCVGVAHAASSHTEFVKEAQEKVKETSGLKAQCEEATKAAREAADEALVFFAATNKTLETIAADPNEVEKTKSKGRKLIEKATQAAEKAEQVRAKTSESATQTDGKVELFLTGVEKENALKAVVEAESAARDAVEHIDAAKTHAELVEGVLQKLDDAVAAAKEKKKEEMKQEKEKQVNSPAQPLSKDPSLGEPQGHTEGNQAEQTQGKQKQHYRSTVTINIHGDNLDALLNGAANNSGMALNDGSSSSALLRVPLLLLLLLLSVLSCMAVC